MLLHIIRRWRLSSTHRKDLDVLLSDPPPPSALLRKRLDWFVDLMQWIRSKGSIKHQVDFTSGTPQAGRIRYLIQMLERNPQWRQGVAAALRSILQETSALEILVSGGVSNPSGFWSEAVERIGMHLLPKAPENHDLAQLFSEVFKSESDALWFEQLDSETFQSILNLYCFKSGPDDFSHLHQNIGDALLLLAIQIEATGLSADIRHRLNHSDFKTLPFFGLSRFTQDFLSSCSVTEVGSKEFLSRLEKCCSALEEVYSQLDEYGVSVHIVYQIERINSQLSRMKVLAELLTSEESRPELLSKLTVRLIREHLERRSLLSLIKDDLSMLSRKISERSAQTGEHYITRTRGELLHMFGHACGGGFITAFTILIKTMLAHVGTSPLMHGLINGLNYSASFVLIQFQGFTLATKQPAMTANALAARMNAVEDPKALSELVDEILHLLRSQTIAVIGNILAVAPTILALDFIIHHFFHHHILSEEKSVATVESLSLFGLTLYYAALTGGLLWLSSIISGWIDNWAAYRKLSAALTHNRRLNFVLGERRTRALALWLKMHLAGLSGNISLGFMLALTPIIGEFIGLPIDVRHVTLSSGSLAAAAASLGTSVFLAPEFWFSVVGILGIGTLNLTVAFSLSLLVAIRARNVKAPGRKMIYHAVWERVRKNPLVLFIP